ncbi:MAG: hypothetical protein JWQ74_3086 [Marmoricola sp.]|nr:hypothetical protein [Marmoricola sp.]
MSTLSSPARAWSPRAAGAAVEKARLALVPTRRSQAPRAPFAILVLLLLAGGVVGLLMFNTHMQQSSFYATKLQARADALTAQRQALDMQLDRLRDPQRLAAAAKKLGMVAPPVPAFVRLSDGKVLGQATPATPEDKVLTKGFAAPLPASLNRKPIVRHVKAKISGQTQAGHGAASTGAASARDRKGTATSSQGASR